MLIDAHPDAPSAPPRQYSFTDPVSITHLPNELLVVIFKHVYRYSRDYIYPTVSQFNGLNYGDDREYTREEIALSHAQQWPRRTNLRSRRIFPYAVAAVCPLWHAVLGTVPEFWTRLVINIDRNASSFSDVQSHLSWSQNLPLEVTVWRHDRDYGSDDPLERDRVALVTQLLSPHFHRFKRAHIEVTARWSKRVNRFLTSTS
ncbi:hypothetical protein PLICRDRAFT_34399 [Plicaturopsis crispa FD-325 SS-3]|nr:hypothetical protein PLICRDRAFT_34399 [Plicaturopsis crispa FD-325 SS-3]